MTSGQWSEILCDLAGITSSHLSQLASEGTIIGPITEKVSRLTGLDPGIPVVNGGQDQCCAALAMGIDSPGQLMLGCGTAWVITGVIDSPANNRFYDNMDLSYHVLPNRWTVSQLLGGFGATVQWWLDNYWQNITQQLQMDQREQYALFNKKVSQSPEGSKGLLFIPPSCNTHKISSPYEGTFAGLRLDHSRAEMGRAVLEGTAYEVRWAMEKMQQNDTLQTSLYLDGGTTKSPIWLQILADVTNRPLFTTEYSHLAALGAVILGGVGYGIFIVV